MILNWISVITGFFYIALGIVVIIYKFFIMKLEPNVAYALGVVIMIYGVFRIVRAILRLKQLKDEK
jgi:uncharacterized membrane protein HdeD (DUF308 family)